MVLLAILSGEESFYRVLHRTVHSMVNNGAIRTAYGLPVEAETVARVKMKSSTESQH